MSNRFRHRRDFSDAGRTSLRWLNPRPKSKVQGPLVMQATLDLGPLTRDVSYFGLAIA